ncbi:MAG: hypothetical protein K0R07_1233 [Sedimentibacter sp.]|jgi:hypothetical protein|nr:hypothetical protein [Sedimentibacter sp.]
MTTSLCNEHINDIPILKYNKYIAKQRVNVTLFFAQTIDKYFSFAKIINMISTRIFRVLTEN